MFKSQGFNELSEDALSFILLSDRLKMDEEDILGKVTEWATVNSVCKRAEGGSYRCSAGLRMHTQYTLTIQVVTGLSLGEVALKVISQVRFALLDPEKLSQVERDNHQKNFIPVSHQSLLGFYFILLDRTDYSCIKTQ